MGRPQEALAEFSKMPTDDPFRLTGEALVAARIGDRGGAEQLISQTKQLFGAAMSYQYAQICAQLGQKTQALAELDNALAARDVGLYYLKLDPFMDPIRGDPHFAAVIRKLNFP